MTNNKQKLSAAEQVVEDIRELRRRLWNRAGNDVRRFLEELDQSVPWEQIKSRRPDTDSVNGADRSKT